ncbi:uncharacterized protein BYT42DRAFT_488631 [Radiomyces spectabilis]|uniref:uncharacterized protein n=1 Tax=Radiomyces spectabilis TaxID=64574 RepID=UPI00221EAD3B|nr:uncharacterized protein BYT42DRAFT_488631 [Radiomyces spectabilis]KAI8393853.1 hypothetical protein BYT42DRAFT_488631 [Radiomyces spectabilis]
MGRILDEIALRNLDAKDGLSQFHRLTADLDRRSIPLDEEIYVRFLSIYGKLGMLDMILPLLNDMEKRAVRPDIHVMNKALYLAAQAGDAILQAEVLARMEKYDIKPTKKSYMCMIWCMRNNMELERALDTLDVMEQQKIEPSVTSYLHIIDLAVHSAQSAVAYYLLQKAEHLPEFAAKDKYLYMQVLRCAAVNDDYTIAKASWQVAVNEKKIRPDDGVCLHVLRLAGKHGDVRLANDVIRQVGEMGFCYTHMHFEPLVQAFASTMDLKRTFRIFSVMRQTGVQPNKNTAAPVVYKLGRDVNAIRQARESLLELAQEDAADIIAFNAILHAFAFNGQTEETIETYRNVSKFRVTPDVDTLNAVLDACIHSKNYANGVEILKEFQQVGIAMTATSLSKMVTLSLTQDNYEDAFKYLEETKSLGLVPLRGCYYMLVKKLARTNDPRLPTVIEDMKACGYEISTHINTHIERHSEEVDEGKRSQEMNADS